MERLPCLKSSHLMQDILTGRLDTIDVDDIFNSKLAFVAQVVVYRKYTAVCVVKEKYCCNDKYGVLQQCDLHGMCSEVVI